jgi:hypothetical protein
MLHYLGRVIIYTFGGREKVRNVKILYFYNIQAKGVK